MNRRQFLSLSAALPGLGLVQRLGAQVRGAGGQNPRLRDARPNFVFIMADDMGPFDLGCYGQKLIRTPHCDKAAAEGMRFTDCYAGASVCAPSRSVLMTGQHTGHTTVRSNMSLRDGGRVPLRAEDRTIAALLKGPEWRGAYDEERAYATALFGKWGLGEAGTTGLPNDHGFDEFYGFLNQQHAHEHYVQYLWRNKTREPLRGNRDGAKQEYASDLMAREALHFIDRHRYEPFFLYFSPTVPHAKIEAPELGEYADKPWPDTAKHYAAMVTRFDSYVGRILDKLKECGLEENTVVFITSDNGGTSDYKPFASLGPFREKKGSIYEGGVRVPMIVRWPGKIRAGAVSSLPWGFQDVLPTLAELAEARGIPSNVDGRSVAPTLLGKEQDPNYPIYFEQVSARRFAQSVRMGRWKAIRMGLNAPLALYDLQNDVGETRDVASGHPDVVAKFEQYLANCRTESPEYPIPSEARPRAGAGAR